MSAYDNLLQFEREILKDPHYIGHSAMLQSQYTPKMYNPRAITVTTIPGTEVTCTLCMGTKMAATGHQSNQFGTRLWTLGRCPNCNGTGKMRLEKGEALR